MVLLVGCCFFFSSRSFTKSSTFFRRISSSVITDTVVPLAISVDLSASFTVILPSSHRVIPMYSSFILMTFSVPISMSLGNRLYFILLSDV